jgi:predicted SpoU family rRNA methylase
MPHDVPETAEEECRASFATAARQHFDNEALHERIADFVQRWGGKTPIKSDPRHADLVRDFLMVHP